MRGLILGIDQGSSGTKSLLIRRDGTVVAEQYIPLDLPELRQGRMLQDPAQILDSIRTLLADACSAAERQGEKISAWGLSCQRSGVLAWEIASGKILHPLISWQDTSSRGLMERLRPQAEEFRQKTGLPLSAHYAGGKIASLQREFAAPGVHCGFLDEYLLYELSGRSRMYTEETFAARSLLYDTKKRCWDPALCAYAGVDPGRLSKVEPSLQPRGLVGGIPLMAVLGDQQAALFAAGSFHAGAVLNLGTIASLLLPCGETRPDCPGYISSVFYSTGKTCRYQLEATVNCCGKTMEYILQQNYVSALVEVDRVFGATPTAGLLYFPFGDVAAPDWLYDVPNVIAQPEPRNIVRALIQNLGNFIARQIGDLQAARSPVLVSGGVSRSECLLQYVADVSGATLCLSEIGQSSAYGAALAAMAALGEKLPLTRPRLKEFKPRAGMSSQEYQDWLKLKAEVDQGRVPPGFTRVPSPR